MRDQSFRGRAIAAAAALLVSAVSGFAQTGQPMPMQPAAAGATVTRRLSVDEAVQLALEQNLNVQVERINPQLQDLTIAQVRGNYSPTVTSTVASTSNDSPPSSFLSGGQDKITQEQFQANYGVAQLTPWGGSYSVGWNNTRSTTNSIFTNFNPQVQSSLALNVVQPLLRGFRIDGVRQQLQVSRKNREISDDQLRQTVANTMRSVKNAYWDLSFAISNLAVQQQSLELARQSLRDNRARVEIGTMAPIDIVQAEAEVAQREETLIVAESAIAAAQDRIRALIFDPSTPEFWNIAIEPTDAPAFQPVAVDLDAAIRNAMDKRTDLQQIRKTLEANDISIGYFRTLTLPQVDLQVNYGLTGLGGTQFLRASDGFPGTIIGETGRSYGSVLGDIFQNQFPQWTVGLNFSYPLGRSTQEAQLARARLQNTQAKKQLDNLQLQAVQQVRDLARQVTTNAKRVDATRASRQFAERRLEAEEKKFTAGMSTTFFVLQAQRDLAQARNNELQAVLDYNKSIVDFQTVQEAPLGAAGGAAAVTVGGATTTSSTTTGGTSSTTSQNQTQRQGGN